MNSISRYFALPSPEMEHLHLGQVKPGDRVVVIKDGLDMQVYVNNALVAKGNGTVPEFLEDADREFNGSFLADVAVTEKAGIELIFYPRYFYPGGNRLLEQDRSDV